MMEHQELNGLSVPFSERETSPEIKFELGENAGDETWKKHKDYPELYNPTTELYGRYITIELKKYVQYADHCAEHATSPTYL